MLGSMLVNLCGSNWPIEGTVALQVQHIGAIDCR